MSNTQIFLVIHTIIALASLSYLVCRSVYCRKRILLTDLLRWLLVCSLPVGNLVFLFVWLYDDAENIVLWQPKEKHKVNKLESKHVHANLMCFYAEDSMVTNIPWQFWETDSGTGGQKWTHCVTHPNWHPNVQYRRKSK